MLCVSGYVMLPADGLNGCFCEVCYPVKSCGHTERVQEESNTCWGHWNDALLCKQLDCGRGSISGREHSPGKGEANCREV